MSNIEKNSLLNAIIALQASIDANTAAIAAIGSPCAITLPTWPTSGTSMTLDAAWHDVDISGTYGASKHLVFLYINTSDNAAGQTVMFRPNGSGDVSSGYYHEVANVGSGKIAIVQTDANGVFEYKCLAGFTWAQYRILGVLS